MSARTFLFHTHGFALGGTITQPFKAEIESHASISLPVTGGFASAKAASYGLREIISYKSARSYVSGIENDDGTRSTVSTSAIEGLNILDVVTADLIVGKLTGNHTDGSESEIITAGSSFTNLRIAGVPTEVHLNNDLFTLHSTHSDLLSHFQAQPKENNGSGAKGKIAKKATPGKNRYVWGLSGTDIPKSIEKGMLIPPGADWRYSDGILHTSLVKQIRPVGPDNSSEEPPYAYAIYIPQVGTFYFGELYSSPNTKRLNMVRAQLGSSVAATMAAAAPVLNGDWY